MLQPIRIKVVGQEVEISCRHASTWPPAWAKLGTTPEVLHDAKYLTDAQYEQARTWQRVCGLLEMDPAKCPRCPFAVGPDGDALVKTPKVPYRLEKPKFRNPRPR